MTEGHTPDLIERLRATSSGLCSEDPHKYMAPGITAGDCLEAADELTSLRAENQRLNAEVERWIKSQGIAFDQAMENGNAATTLRANLDVTVSALARIAEDLGHCGTCGTPASGIVECDCAKPEWAPDDYKAVARAALDALGLAV